MSVSFKYKTEIPVRFSKVRDKAFTRLGFYYSNIGIFKEKLDLSNLPLFQRLTRFLTSTLSL